MKSLSWRIVVSLLVLLASIVYVLPSLPGVGGSSLGNLLPDARISLGLDLKGGMHLTLGVEVDKAVSNSLSLTGQELRAQASEKGITVLRSRLTPDNRLEFLLPRAEQRTELQELLSKDFPQLAVDSPTQVEGGGLRFTAAFTPAAKAKIEEMALDQAVRTIRKAGIFFQQAIYFLRQDIFTAAPPDQTIQNFQRFRRFFRDPQKFCLPAFFRPDWLFFRELFLQGKRLYHVFNFFQGFLRLSAQSNKRHFILHPTDVLLLPFHLSRPR